MGAISRRISSQAGEVLRLLLRQAYLVSPANAQKSNAVSYPLLRDNARKAKMETKYLEEHLTVIGVYSLTCDLFRGSIPIPLDYPVYTV